ncbi:MAG: hypothetical protein JW779_03795 [Candidatus Thorarchaeota archaeon]|nr:hypothetical protein [Candidatus Thorarchaeota archaeon]
MTEPLTQDIFTRLTSIKSANVIQRYGFDEFLAIAREVRGRVGDDVWLEVGWEILDGIGLEEFYGCDYDILTALEHIPSDSDLEDIQTFLRHSLVETLLEQFDNEGTTILLDIAKMVGTPAAALIPKIIELRKKEVQDTIIPIMGKEIIIYDIFMNEVNRTSIPEKAVWLEPLWMTAYGYQTLYSMNFGLYTNLKELDRIANVMRKLDVSFRTLWNPTSEKKPQTQTSEALRSIILKRAINGHKQKKR